ncbi:unnamed protein product, partial [Gulo gulo]
MTQRCRIEAVQQVMSDDSQKSQTTWPSVQRPVTVYMVLMGITRMDTSSRSAVQCQWKTVHSKHLPSHSLPGKEVNKIQKEEKKERKKEKK